MYNSTVKTDLEKIIVIGKNNGPNLGPPIELAVLVAAVITFGTCLIRTQAIYSASHLSLAKHINPTLFLP